MDCTTGATCWAVDRSGGHPKKLDLAERLIQTLKEEEIHLNGYKDITQARTRIKHFITQVPNHKRPHSVLGYLTPVEFEKRNSALPLLILGLNYRCHFKAT